MINLDDEIEGEIVISSAAGVTVDFLGDNNSEKPIGDTGVEISLTGLTGGHSGDEIDKNRLNGIIAMGEILDDLREKNIAYQLAEFKARHPRQDDVAEHKADGIRMAPEQAQSHLTVVRQQYLISSFLDTRAKQRSQPLVVFYNKDSIHFCTNILVNFLISVFLTLENH